ncbi:hypothetical protein TD95_001681 [Thielaviopsis punctulata]|uniref:AAA+ ATPase domain-containing protein n=1 Tax=Thielaviopsis punctulata TaxID=72032 RepID=A0A0F4ZG99_9PEZI|nr:hypothetical protein TD95_001681 [Thielaviopsis punctulata]
MNSLAPCRLRAVSASVSKTATTAAAVRPASIGVRRDFHLTRACPSSTPTNADSAPAGSAATTPDATDPAPENTDPSAPPPHNTEAAANNNNDNNDNNNSSKNNSVVSERFTLNARRLRNHQQSSQARLRRAKTTVVLEAQPSCDLPEEFMLQNVHLHEPFAQPEWPVFEEPNWRSLQASWLQQFYGPHVLDSGGSGREGAAETVAEAEGAAENAVPAKNAAAEPAAAQDTDPKSLEPLTTPETEAEPPSEPSKPPATKPNKLLFDRYRLHFLLAEWKQGELKKALNRDLGAIERRTAVASLSAAYALYAWHIENGVSPPASLLETIDAVRKAAPSYWALDKPVRVKEDKPEDYFRGEDSLANEAIEAMSMPYMQSPTVFIPEMILQKPPFFPDDVGKSSPVSEILEVEKSIYVELNAKPPAGKKAFDIRRPITVIETSKYGGKRFSKSLVKHIATSVGADLVRIDACGFSKILGKYLGEDWALSRGPFSLLGFRTAFVNDTLALPQDLLDYLGVQDMAEDAPDFEGMVFGGHSREVSADAFKDELAKIKEEPMGYLLSSTDRWGNLKIQAALERIIRAATIKAKGAESDKLIIQVDDFVELSQTLEGALIIGRLRHMIDSLWLKGTKVILVGTSSAKTRVPVYLRAVREIASSESLIPFKAEPRLALDHFEWAGSEKVDFLDQNCQNLRHVINTIATEPVDPEFVEQQLPFSALAAYRDGLERLREQRWWSREAIKEPLKKLFDELRDNLGRDCDPSICSGIVPFTELYPLAQRIVALSESPYVLSAAAFKQIHDQLESDKSPLSEAGKKEAHAKALKNRPGSKLAPPTTNKQHLQVPKLGADADSDKNSHENFPKNRPTPISRGGRDRQEEAADQGRDFAHLKLNEYEKKLITGLIDASQIKTTFSDVHLPAETIQALKLLTMLSLQRPDAFGYGVLARDRIPGCLLYGPPGTGKTLLAKAVAKESGASMLEISSASINEMWVGQGEKNVAAVFSLAKKLAPLVIFIDEADALLAMRGRSTGTAPHREIINEFLREWDGMNNANAFIMVATNRPFDLDEAVLRRLPRKLLIDLPVQADRAAILEIILKDEQLAADISIPDLAQRTPLYSGSDLKNLCVAAAMAAVREETEVAEKHTGDTPYVYPARRTLRKEHFDHALKEIGASISNDMETMKGIRKFDEVHGKPGERKQRAAMGFGKAAAKKMDAEDVRVRNTTETKKAEKAETKKAEKAETKKAEKIETKVETAETNA